MRLAKVSQVERFYVPIFVAVEKSCLSGEFLQYPHALLYRRHGDVRGRQRAICMDTPPTTHADHKTVERTTLEETVSLLVAFAGRIPGGKVPIP